MSSIVKDTFRLKGVGSRLVRSEKDDWLNVQALEGTDDWKKGYVFLRTYCYQQGEERGHLYRIEAVAKLGLNTEATAYGKTAGEAWDALVAVLESKGVKPADSPK